MSPRWEAPSPRPAGSGARRSRRGPGEAGAGGRMRLLRLFVMALLVAATAGHYLFHYAPRERAASPAAEDHPGLLLADGTYDVRLWIPYPHQNLARLADTVPDRDAWLSAAARASGFEARRLPGFGPFAAPPAREMTVAADRDGGRFRATARVYPLIAGVARLAGKVASNPWLGGGEVSLSGAPATVSWSGSLWTVATADGAGTRSAAEPGAASDRALARLAVARPLGRVPPGRYRLVRTESGFAVGGEGPIEPAPRIDLADSGTLAVAVAAVVGGGRRQAGAIFEGEGRLDLPPMAVLARGGGRRWSLPGESVLKRLRRGLPTGRSAGWSITALDEPSLERAARLAPLLPSERRASSAPSLAVWARPRPARQALAETADALSKVPIVGRSRARRWRDWSTLLAPFDRWALVYLETSDRSDGLRVELAS